MSVRIIVDSTTDMTPETAKGVSFVVPLTVHFGEKEYLDGIDITTAQFYEMLVTGQLLPTTSQPTPFAFTEVFQEAVEAGDEVVCITVSAKLSGTHQSAMIAAADYPGKVFVVDSQTIAIGEGILTEYALKLKAEGHTAGQITEALETIRNSVKLFAMVDTLEYLKKGGRISPAVAMAGGLLNIKPIITIQDGELQMAGKARGTKQAASQMALLIEKAGGVDPDMPLLFGYTGKDDALIRQYIADTEGQWPRKPVYSSIGSVVGTHAGPGAIAVAFFGKD